MKKSAAAFLATGAVAAAGGIGTVNGPQKPSRGLWYLLLRKPKQTPSGPVIGAAWSILELLLIRAGYNLLVSEKSRLRNWSLASWVVTLFGLAGYPKVFFRQKRLKASSITAAAMFSAAAATAVTARKVDRSVMWLMLPVVVWLGGATMLSIKLQLKNKLYSSD